MIVNNLVDLSIFLKQMEFDFNSTNLTENVAENRIGKVKETAVIAQFYPIRKIQKN